MHARWFLSGGATGAGVTRVAEQARSPLVAEQARALLGQRAGQARAHGRQIGRWLAFGGDAAGTDQNAEISIFLIAMSFS
jgi:hypothetical protein